MSRELPSHAGGYKWPYCSHQKLKADKAKPHSSHNSTPDLVLVTSSINARQTLCCPAVQTQSYPYSECMSDNKSSISYTPAQVYVINTPDHG
jgi:hypothetical protein